MDEQNDPTLDNGTAPAADERHTPERRKTSRGTRDRRSSTSTRSTVAARASDGPNPFFTHFPIRGIVFKMNLKEPGKPWSNGTTSQTVADVLLPIGDNAECGYLQSCRIVLLRYPAQAGGGQSFDLQLPSTGSGDWRRPMLSVGDNARLKTQQLEWRQAVVDQFHKWRAKAVAEGAEILGTSVPRQGVIVDERKLAELGLNIGQVLTNK